MRIKVKGYLTLREVIGDQHLQFNQGETITIYNLLAKLSLKCGDEFEETVFDPETEGVSQYVAILINGCHYSHLPDRLDTELRDQDEVAIFPPTAGG